MASGKLWMVAAMIKHLAFALAATALGTWLLSPTTASAQDRDPARPKPHASEPRTTIQTRVERHPDGVYIQIEVRQRVPGTGRSPLQQPTGGRPSTGARPDAAGASTISGGPAANTTSATAP